MSNPGLLTSVYQCRAPELSHKMTETSDAETRNPVKIMQKFILQSGGHDTKIKIEKQFLFAYILQQFSVYKLKYKYILYNKKSVITYSWYAILFNKL